MSDENSTTTPAETNLNNQTPPQQPMKQITTMRFPLPSHSETTSPLYGDDRFDCNTEAKSALRKPHTNNRPDNPTDNEANTLFLGVKFTVLFIALTLSLAAIGVIKFARNVIS